MGAELLAPLSEEGSRLVILAKCLLTIDYLRTLIFRPKNFMLESPRRQWPPERCSHHET